MAAGVTIEDPATTYIDRDVADRRRHGHPSGRLARRADGIGAGCEIHSGARIVDSQIGDRAHRPQPLRDHRRHDRQRRSVGPFAHLRKQSTIGVEREGRQLRRGEEHGARRRLEGDAPRVSRRRDDRSTTSTSAPARSRATTTASSKHTTTIEDGAFIGSDTQLIAPVTVGKGAYVGTGTTVREDVPPGALAVSAGKQRNIEGWVEKRRDEGEVATEA